MSDDKNMYLYTQYIINENDYRTPVNWQDRKDKYDEVMEAYAREGTVLEQ